MNRQENVVRVLINLADKLEESLAQFHRDAKAKFGVDRIVTSRVGDLFVKEVGFAFEIRETEGEEQLWDVSRRKTIRL